jgi:hypothetical protein
LGLWDFVVTETGAGTGSSGSSTLISPEDFDRSRPGLEMTAQAASTACQPGPPSIFKFKDIRTYLSTDGVALTTFEVPQINAEVPFCPTTIQNRTSAGFFENRGVRVYVYTRALYPPSATLGSTGTWHISVYDLSGTLRWSREFRPAGGAGSDPDDLGWFIQVGRSAVGDLLYRGARRDVIRVWRQSSSPAAVQNRYTFLDLLTGQVVRDIVYEVTRPTLQ